MVEPVTKAVSDVSQAVGKGFDVITKGLEIYQDHKAREERAEVRSDERIAEARRTEEARRAKLEHYLRQRADDRADRKWDADQRDARDQRRLLARKYPLHDGPGALARAVDLLYPGSQPSGPLVLITPASRLADKKWRSLGWQVRNTLGFLHDSSAAALVRETDRWMDWPHPGLIEHDLGHLPALVVSVDVVNKKLQVRIGGCNLGGDRVRALSQVVSTYLPHTDYFTDETVDFLEKTSRDGFTKPPTVDARKATRNLQREWAVRLVAVSVVAAIDAFHLLRTRGYREQVDEVLRRVHPTMPAPASLPYPRLEALADPAYHLLHHARRMHEWGDEPAAQRLIVESVRLLAFAPDGELAHVVQTANEMGSIKPWHRALLAELQQQVPGEVRAALLAPAAEDGREASEQETSSSMDPRTSGTQYSGRPINRTAEPRSDQAQREYLSRPINRTRGAN